MTGTAFSYRLSAWGAGMGMKLRAAFGGWTRSPPHAGADPQTAPSQSRLLNFEIRRTLLSRSTVGCVGWRRFLVSLVIVNAAGLADRIGRMTGSRNYRGARFPVIPITVSIGAGFVALVGFGIPVPGYLWALACLAAGSLLGIVFGIPRSASQPPAGDQARVADLQANTNMEQISDWLTKLLVGAGLVELKDLPHAIQSAAQFIAPAISSKGEAASPALISVAAAIVIYFSVEGFIGGYIFTRVYFVMVLHLIEERLRHSEGREKQATT